MVTSTLEYDDATASYVKLDGRRPGSCLAQTTMITSALACAEATVTLTESSQT